MVVIATVILLNFRCEISLVQVIESILMSFMSAISVMSIKQYSISFVVGTNELHYRRCVPKDGCKPSVHQILARNRGSQ